MVDVTYHEVLGSLLVLSTRTRPDIAAAVSVLAKLASAPAPRHWSAMQYLVRSSSRTRSHGIVLIRGLGTTNFVAYSDGDWAEDKTKSKSRSGFVLMFNETPFLWKSKLQSSIALSTSEAEIAAFLSCVRNVS